MITTDLLVTTDAGTITIELLPAVMNLDARDVTMMTHPEDTRLYEWMLFSQ